MARQVAKEKGLTALRRLRIGLGITIAAIGLAAPAAAHHSTSAYDFSKTVTLQGTVKTFQWTNPHSWLELSVSDGHGGSTVWLLESGTPNVDSRMGWTGNEIMPGDEVGVIIHPKRRGTGSGALMYIHLPNGKVLAAPASLFGNRPASPFGEPAK